MKIIKIIYRSFIDFHRDGGIMLAGSMSYFSIMALIPFCLFIITLFGYFLGHYPEFNKFVLTKMINFYPDVTHSITDKFLEPVPSKGIGKFSLVLYGFLSYQVFASIENALHIIFKVKQKRIFLFSVFISLLVITLLMALLIISFAAASFVPLLKIIQPFGLTVKIGVVKAVIIRFILPFVLILFTVTIMYLLLPRVKVRFYNAFKGAVFTTILFEVAKHVFTWYVSTVIQLGKIYGSLTAFIIFLLWGFYSSSIFLIGAEVVHNLGNSKKSQSNS